MLKTKKTAERFGMEKIEQLIQLDNGVPPEEVFSESKENTESKIEDSIKLENASGKKSRIDLVVPIEVKEHWQDFFKARGVSLSKGIALAIKHLEDDCKNNKVSIGFTGIN